MPLEVGGEDTPAAVLHWLCGAPGSPKSLSGLPLAASIEGMRLLHCGQDAAGGGWRGHARGCFALALWCAWQPQKPLWLASGGKHRRHATAPLWPGCRWRWVERTRPRLFCIGFVVRLAAPKASLACLWRQASKACDCSTVARMPLEVGGEHTPAAVLHWLCGAPGSPKSLSGLPLAASIEGMRLLHCGRPLDPGTSFLALGISD